MTKKEMVLDQLKEGVLKVPFSQFHADLQEVLDRPVWTHELALNYQGIIDELEGKVEAPTLSEIVSLIPADKRVGVALGAPKSSPGTTTTQSPSSPGPTTHGIT